MTRLTRHDLDASEDAAAFLRDLEAAARADARRHGDPGRGRYVETGGCLDGMEVTAADVIWEDQ